MGEYKCGLPIECSDLESLSRSWHIWLQLTYWMTSTSSERLLSPPDGGVKAQMFDLSFALSASSLSSSSSLFIPLLPLSSLCSPVGLPSCHTVLELVLNSVLSSCHPVFSSAIHPSACPSSHPSLGSSVYGRRRDDVRMAGA